MLIPFGWKVSMSMMLLKLLIDLNTKIVVGELTAVVNTTAGPVQGEIRETALNSIKYAVFKGIRYAEPPLQYRRFKPPIPAYPWKKTLNATIEADHCVRIEFGKFVGSEDCLFLNVFTPVTNLTETPKKLKSVIVYIYGGAWMKGSSRIDIYGPDFLLERDVLFVSFNYRGGTFGFLNLNHSNATGNAGLKDQTLVLKWVQANIQFFGGNPKNVTIMGSSSGGMSVGYHIISDASVGLFHGAISMSGTPLMPWAFQSSAEALMLARRVGLMLGFDGNDKESLLKGFYNASAKQLAEATDALHRIVTFRPTIEDESIATDVFLSKCAVEKYFTENFTKVPQMLGFMPQETFTYATCRNTYMAEFFKLVQDSIDIIEYIGMDKPETLTYFLNTSSDVDFEHMTETESDIFRMVVNETTAILFVTPIDITQRIFAAYNDGRPIFHYRITFTIENAPHTRVSSCPMKAAAHSDDIAYLFYSARTNYTFGPNEPLLRTIHRVTTMWTNFVKYGNPTPQWVNEYPLNITWPNSGSKGLSLNIGEELTVEPRPINNFVREIEPYYWAYLFQSKQCRRL